MTNYGLITCAVIIVTRVIGAARLIISAAMYYAAVWVITGVSSNTRQISKYSQMLESLHFTPPIFVELS
jgi:hypothetical protein